MFEPYHQIVSNVSKTILHYEQELQRPVIGVMPAYFPMELIWAAGGFPVQLWGNNLPIETADAYLQSYCCSVARSVLELELRGISGMVKAYAFTSLCDTLINTREIYRGLFDKPTLELSIPITGTMAARKSYLASVVQTVTEGLEAITGAKITPEKLAEASQLYGRVREMQRRLYRKRLENPGLIQNHDFYTILKAGYFLPAQTYGDMLQSTLEALDSLPAAEETRTKLLLSGMVFDPLEVYRIFDELQTDIVDDDFANGWRTVSKDYLRVDHLVDGIAEYLFNPAPCCCIYNPDNDRHAYLLQKAKASGADGVLFWFIKFCEPDAFDRPQLMDHFKEQGIPAAFIDVELTMTNFDAVRTRIHAFCEILESRRNDRI